jgi:hypothetical protein
LLNSVEIHLISIFNTRLIQINKHKEYNKNPHNLMFYEY